MQKHFRIWGKLKQLLNKLSYCSTRILALGLNKGTNYEMKCIEFKGFT